MRGWAPCGLCQSYVPVPEGCRHWTPGLGVKAAKERDRRRVQNEQSRKAIEEFRRIMSMR